MYTSGKGTGTVRKTEVSYFFVCPPVEGDASNENLHVYQQFEKDAELSFTSRPISEPENKKSCALSTSDSKFTKSLTFQSWYHVTSKRTLTLSRKKV